MIHYANGYEQSKKELSKIINSLKKEGFHIFLNKHKTVDDFSIDKIIIKSKKQTKNRIILSAGLHGIEGYVGHSCIMIFISKFLKKISDDTEVIIYHVLNPYGMYHYRRTNHNNVDLNRNYSRNDFTSENEGYKTIRNFFIPKPLSNFANTNMKYYTSLTNMIRKYGVKTLSDSILLGQNYDQNGLYYTGSAFEESTKYIMNEIPINLNDTETCLWLDIHTGYGPRYQMSIVNSKFEKDSTLDLMDNLNYPLILGLGTSDFYDVDGDMIEYIYNKHNEIKSKIKLTALCFEFGTVGNSTLNNIESLKAMVFSNNVRYTESSLKQRSYSKKLMQKQFMPGEDQWKLKASEDFVLATRELLNYKGLLRK